MHGEVGPAIKSQFVCFAGKWREQNQCSAFVSDDTHAFLSGCSWPSRPAAVFGGMRARRVCCAHVCVRAKGRRYIRRNALNGGGGDLMG